MCLSKTQLAPFVFRNVHHQSLHDEDEWFLASPDPKNLFRDVDVLRIPHDLMLSLLFIKLNYTSSLNLKKDSQVTHVLRLSCGFLKKKNGIDYVLPLSSLFIQKSPIMPPCLFWSLLLIRNRNPALRCCVCVCVCGLEDSHLCSINTS
jgi:hypothetical protein